MKQIFGYTGPTPRIGYAPFAQAFEELGKIRLVVRDVGGMSSEILLSADDAASLAAAINTAAFPHLTTMRQS